MMKTRLNAVKLVVMLIFFQINIAFSQTASVSDLFNAIKSEVDAKEMVVLVSKMQEAMKTDNNPSNKMLLDASRSYTAIALGELGEIDLANLQIEKISELEFKESAIVSIARDLAEGKRYVAAQSFISSYLTGKYCTVLPVASKSRNQLDFLYGVSLYHARKYNEALKYLVPRNGIGAGNREYYPLSLVAIGDDAKALPAAHSLIASGVNTSKAFNEVTAKLFLRVEGNTKRYDFLVDSVEKVNRKKVTDKVMKMAVNLPAPNFELNDLNGKKVSLSSLKGKTIILDFWATWCIPCVGSFPGMQKAVDYYKNDSSVVFLFVHAYDKGPTATEDAKKIIRSKNYTFDVFMDLKDKATGKSPVAALFNVNSLPTKIIIDPNGMIRFRNSGFVEVDDAIPEISTMVEIIKG